MNKTDSICSNTVQKTSQNGSKSATCCCPKLLFCFTASFKIQFLSTFNFIETLYPDFLYSTIKNFHAHGPLFAVCSAVSGPLEVPEPQVGNTHGHCSVHTHTYALLTLLHSFESHLTERQTELPAVQLCKSAPSVLGAFEGHPWPPPGTHFYTSVRVFFPSYPPPQPFVNFLVLEACCCSEHAAAPKEGLEDNMDKWATATLPMHFIFIHRL